MAHIPISAAPELKQALFDAMTASSALKGVLVLWDIEDDPGDEEQDLVGFIDEVSEQAPVGMRADNANQREEDLSVRIAIKHVLASVDDQASRQSEARVYALAQAIADAIDGPALRPFGRVFIGRMQREGYKRASDQQWEQRAELDVRARGGRLRVRL